MTNFASGARDEHHRFPHPGPPPLGILVGLKTRVLIDGRALEVGYWGPDTGSSLPLVLLHEGLGSVDRWRDLPEVLANRTGRRIMAYSRFGHGTSDPPATTRTLQFMHEEAERLPQILDRSGLGQVVLLGHSDGASIAILAAARFPDRIAGLILEAPHVFVEDAGLESIELMRVRYIESDLRARLLKHHVHVDAAFGGWADVWLDPAFRNWNIEADLPRVMCPMLVIQGELDRYGTLAQVDAIVGQVSGRAERLVVPDCGHTPHRDQHDLVLDAIVRFVSSLP